MLEQNGNSAVLSTAVDNPSISQVFEVPSGFGTAYGVDVRQDTGEVFIFTWKNHDPSRLHSVSVDGSDYQLHTASLGAIGDGLGINQDTGEVYFAPHHIQTGQPGAAPGGMQLVSSDGTSVQTLSPRPYYVTDIEVDHVNGHVYYSGHSGFTGIRRMDLDGSNEIQITTHAYNGFIALDIDRGKIYYTRDIFSDPNQHARSVYQIDLDGSNQQILLNDIGPRIMDIDLSNDVLYINQHGTDRSIMAYDLETQVLSTVVDTSAIEGFAYDIAVYQPPAGIVIDEDAPEQTVDLTGITAGGGESQPLRVTSTSSSTGLIPNPAVTYTTANATGSIAFTPVADQSGTATITVTVEDGGLDGNLSTAGDNATFSRTFDVTVNAVNDDPTLDAIGNLTINEDVAEQTVNLTGITAGGGETQPLRVTSTSSSTGLIPNPAVTYTTANATGSIAFTPVADASGTATITVTVEDGGLDGNLSTAGDNATVSRTFDVTVNAVIPENPGDVDGDQDFDANDSFLIHLVKLSGTDTQINQSKGSSPLSAVEIRAALTQLNTLGDVDGDQDFDANDSLSGTDAQIDQSKGNSPLTAAQIRANINGLGGQSTEGRAPAIDSPVVQSALGGGQETTASSSTKGSRLNSPAPVPDSLGRNLFLMVRSDEESAPSMLVDVTQPDAASAFAGEGFREWIDAI